MANIEAVLFDNDGTVADTHDLILASFRHATHEVLGVQIPDEVLMARVGVPLVEQMKDFSDDPAFQECLLTTFRTYNHSVHDQMIKPFPGIGQALADLHEEGLALGVVTSKLHWLAWHGIEVMGFAGYFDFLVGADDCATHKPDPGPVLLGCEKAGVLPENAVYVGDSPFDIEAGNAAGCRTVAVDWGMFEKGALLACKPDALISNAADLVAAVHELV